MKIEFTTQDDVARNKSYVTITDGEDPVRFHVQFDAMASARKRGVPSVLGLLATHATAEAMDIVSEAMGHGWIEITLDGEPVAPFDFREAFMSEEDRAYQAGMGAHEQGLTESDNPHSPLSDCYHAWKNGLVNARREAGMDEFYPSTSSTKRESWELTFDEFTGPAMIGDTFATPGRDMDQYDWLWSLATNEANLGAPAWTGEEGHTVRELLDCEPPGTFALIAPDGAPCGFYMDSGLWIDPEHRGKGLSTPLILAAAAFHGGSPTNNTEGLGFSDAGYEAHQRAHRQAVQEAFEAGKPVPSEVLAEYGFDYMSVNPLR